MDGYQTSTTVTQVNGDAVAAGRTETPGPNDVEAVCLRSGRQLTCLGPGLRGFAVASQISSDRTRHRHANNL